MNGRRRQLLQTAASSGGAYGWALLAVGSEFAFELRTLEWQEPVTFFSGVQAQAFRCDAGTGVYGVDCLLGRERARHRIG